MPPLAISACELRRLVDIVCDAIVAATGEAAGQEPLAAAA
jgi:hypothetical protein